MFDFNFLCEVLRTFLIFEVGKLRATHTTHAA